MHVVMQENKTALPTLLMQKHLIEKYWSSATKAFLVVQYFLIECNAFSLKKVMNSKVLAYNVQSSFSFNLVFCDQHYIAAL